MNQRKNKTEGNIALTHLRESVNDACKMTISVGTCLSLTYFEDEQQCAVEVSISLPREYSDYRRF